MCVSQDTARRGIDRLACDLENFTLEVEYIRDDRKRYLKSIKSTLKKLEKEEDRSEQRMVGAQNRMMKKKHRSKKNSVRRAK